MILIITCLVATELVMEFIWNFIVFYIMSNLNTYWMVCHLCGFIKIKLYHHIILFYFLPNEMK
jgi:hypothetical protein